MDLWKKQTTKRLVQTKKKGENFREGKESRRNSETKKFPPQQVNEQRKCGTKNHHQQKPIRIAEFYTAPRTQPAHTHTPKIKPIPQTPTNKAPISPSKLDNLITPSVYNPFILQVV